MRGTDHGDGINGTPLLGVAMAMNSIIRVNKK
jgi:hypothetical protein